MGASREQIPIHASARVQGPVPLAPIAEGNTDRSSELEERLPSELRSRPQLHPPEMGPCSHPPGMVPGSHPPGQGQRPGPPGLGPRLRTPVPLAVPFLVVSRVGEKEEKRIRTQQGG